MIDDSPTLDLESMRRACDGWDALTRRAEACLRTHEAHMAAGTLCGVQAFARAVVYSTYQEALSGLADAMEDAARESGVERPRGVSVEAALLVLRRMAEDGLRIASQPIPEDTLDLAADIVRERLVGFASPPAV